MNKLLFALAVLPFALFSSTANASLIAWGAATDTTSFTNVSTNGTSVSAFNGGTSSPIVNGVQFTGIDALTGSGVASGMLGGQTTTDAGLDTLLNQVDFGGGAGLVSIDLGTFVAGCDYEVQIFFTDQRNAGAMDRVMQFGSDDGIGAGGTVDLDADPDNSTTGMAFGSFAIGTFTADGNDPDLTLDAQGFGNAHISAWQVRKLEVVPEPSSAALLGLVLLGGTLSRRRRN